MITVRDQVSMMFGAEVADVLSREGLLRTDAPNTTVHTEGETATHWRVQVWTTDALRAKYYDVPHSLRNELKQGLREKGFAELVLANATTARRYASMATHAGLNSRVTGMILVEA